MRHPLQVSDILRFAAPRRLRRSNIHVRYILAVATGRHSCLLLLYSQFLFVCLPPVAEQKPPLCKGRCPKGAEGLSFLKLKQPLSRPGGRQLPLHRGAFGCADPLETLYRIGTYCM